MSTGIIVQARLNSNRFPRKVFARINGKKLIDIVVDECKRTGIQTIVATPDKEIAKYFIEKTDVYMGSESDVIGRFSNCAKHFELDIIIRVCADSKNVKSELISQQLENFNKYKHTCYGNFCEVFSFNDLEWYYEHDKRPETREHVTLGMLQDMTVDYEIDLK